MKLLTWHRRLPTPFLMALTGSAPPPVIHEMEELVLNDLGRIEGCP
jgi:hypothetical protein